MGVGQAKYGLTKTEYSVLSIIASIGDSEQLTTTAIQDYYRPGHYRRDTHLVKMIRNLKYNGFVEPYRGYILGGKFQRGLHYKITPKGLEILIPEHLEYCRILSIGD